MIEEAPADDTEEQAETGEAPLSILGGQIPEPGEVVRLKVVSVDQEAGTWTYVYAHDSKKPGALDEMETQFTKETES